MQCCKHNLWGASARLRPLARMAACAVGPKAAEFNVLPIACKVARNTRHRREGTATSIPIFLPRLPCTRLAPRRRSGVVRKLLPHTPPLYRPPASCTRFQAQPHHKHIIHNPFRLGLSPHFASQDLHSLLAHLPHSPDTLQPSLALPSPLTPPNPHPILRQPPWLPPAAPLSRPCRGLRGMW